MAVAAAAALVLSSCSGGGSSSQGYQGEDTFQYSTSGCPQVKVQQGVLEGTLESGIKIFRGIPFAAPPVGDLRWKAPQPVQPWTGVREAKKFGDDPMQGNPFGDMGFNAEKKSEDCLYLNIWTPAKSASDGLPSVIYFNGGGLYAGSGSEPRYAGEAMAREGIISITANYREGIFGFFSHPELSAETSYGGSGNWGFLDQTAAIKWVHDNIAAFGGDPSQITIVGESAGSMSVSAQIATPLTKGLFARAMASSGSVTAGTIATQEEADAQGIAKLQQMGVSSIAEARALSADEVLLKGNSNGVPPYNVDGYFFPEQPADIYEKGLQQKVPLLVGRNSAEMTPMMFLRGQAPTLENVRPILAATFGDKVDEAMALYGFKTDADVLGKPGVDYASDLFIAYSTWKFGYLHAKTSGQPVYRYYFSKPRPRMVMQGVVAALAGGVQKVEEGSSAPAPQPQGFVGAAHSADIEYAMGTLPTNRVYDWQPEDYYVSAQFLSFYANFIKTGNPNGLGLPDWHTINGKEFPPQMIIDVDSHEVVDETFEKRNKFLIDYMH
ncbi:MAG: carboxylesterase family protein [Bacteroidales bacterium]|nr:carboxylesterase family protein [Bacteroidales bacterium]